MATRYTYYMLWCCHAFHDARRRADMLRWRHETRHDEIRRLFSMIFSPTTFSQQFIIARAETLRDIEMPIRWFSGHGGHAGCRRRIYHYAVYRRRHDAVIFSFHYVAGRMRCHHAAFLLVPKIFTDAVIAAFQIIMIFSRTHWYLRRHRLDYISSEYCITFRS